MIIKTLVTAIAVSALAISAGAAVEAIDAARPDHCSPKARAGGGDAPVFVTVQLPSDRLDAAGLPDRRQMRQALLLSK
jgi:hypothetical protein